MRHFSRRIGDVVAHFRIVDPLGAGGMAEVYKAEDLRLGRLVALKFLPASESRDEGAKARLMREAQAASALDHPNLCTIHDIGESADGELFIAMSFYEGETLKDRLARGRPSLEETLGITHQVAAGLDRAHVRGIIHGDIKPANLMITSDAVIKILDFGLAVFAEAGQRSSGDHLRGTPVYMSPEQVAGWRIDHRTDLWSLGVVLYEMLTGSLPFRGNGLAAVLEAIQVGTFAPVTAFRPDLPPEVGELVARCLARDPAARFRSAAELQVALQRVGSDDPLGRSRAAEEQPTIDLRLPLPPWQGSLAVLPLRDAGTDADRELFGLGVTDQIIANLAAVPALRVIARTSVMAYRETDKEPRRIAAELGVSHLLTGTIYSSRRDHRIRVHVELVRAMDGVAVWSQGYDRNLDDFLAVQAEVAKAIAGALEIAVTPQVIEAMNPGAVSYDTWVAVKEATLFADEYYFRLRGADYRRALRAARRAIRLDRRYAAAHVTLSYVASLRAYLAGHLVKLLAEAARRGPRRWFHSLAARIVRRRCLAAAQRHAARAYALAPASPLSWMAVGGVHLLKAEYDQAFHWLKRSLADHPNNALAIHLLARTLSHGVQLFDLAVPYYDRAIAINPRSPYPYHNRGFCWMNLGRLAEAAADFAAALELQPHDHAALGGECELAVMRGDLEQAADCIRRREALRADTSESLKGLVAAARGEPGAPSSRSSSKAYALLGRADEALAALERSIATTGLPGYLELAHNRLFGSLRGSSGFERLLAERRRVYDALVERYAPQVTQPS